MITISIVTALLGGLDHRTCGCRPPWLTPCTPALGAHSQLASASGEPRPGLLVDGLLPWLPSPQEDINWLDPRRAIRCSE
eukprot:5578691-Pleurochrysis_carterae.AAC.4